MGFEQLAELKKQLQQQARQARQQEAAEKTAQDSAQPSTEQRAGKDGEGRGRRGGPQGVHGAPKQARPGERPGRPHARKPHGGAQGRPAGSDAAQPAGQSAGHPTGQEGRPQAGHPRQADPRGRQKNRPQQEPVDPVVHAIGKLQKRFPAAFPKKPAPKLPLKIGILEDLLPHAQELSLSEAEVREAIATWCRGSRYWMSLTEGAARVDLNGAPAGQVSARDMAFARNSQRGGPRRPRNAEGAAQTAEQQPRTADQAQPHQRQSQAAEEAPASELQSQSAEQLPKPEQQTATSTPSGDALQPTQPAQAAGLAQSSPVGPENAASPSASTHAATE
ncbi:ProQ/FinO family protein [Paraburkholderia rhizosphaerae]|uniref:ProP effector n=1 Tax=Paraburkholderia rhizosphaerae TaxID=480658 RepID=A0A4R8LXE1_9BURK|nr:ProQ/FinO family protein [Paraburkholderia rhizosphaerae]TDY51485.1 ProP effector [Paraburkholderia rhizosphaerae]